MLVEVGFWACLWLVIYVYVGYPATAFLLAQIRQCHVRKTDIEPSVTVLISAFNEELEIERTVLNKLTQAYPPDRLDVIVVSDGSIDQTDEIVETLAEHSGGRLRFLRQEPRQGKTAALNRAVALVTADIFVVADANSIYAPDAIRHLVRSFADPSVGYVTGRMVYSTSGGSGVGVGSGSYMHYENMLRTLETRLGSVVGVDGGIDAVRRDLYVPMRPEQLPDFVLPLCIVEQGKRVVYEPDALLYEPALSGAGDEFRMRVRVSLRAFWALHDKRSLLDPRRYPLFAWQLLSHKVLRYGAFLPLTGLFVFNALVMVRISSFYGLFFLLQLAFYVLAAAGHWFKRALAGAPKLVMPYYFAILNLACAVAFWKFLNGERIVIWKPRGGA